MFPAKMFGSKKGIVLQLGALLIQRLTGTALVSIVAVVVVGFFVGFPVMFALFTKDWLLPLLVIAFIMIWSRR